MAGEAGEVELGLANRPHTVLLREHDMTGGASRAKHPVKVSLAIELTKLGKAGGGKGVLADGAPQAILVQVRPSNLHHKGVPDREPALRALGHGLLLSSWSLGFNIHRHRGGGVFVVTLLHTWASCATASGLLGQQFSARQLFFLPAHNVCSSPSMRGDCRSQPAPKLPRCRRKHRGSDQSGAGMV